MVHSIQHEVKCIVAILALMHVTAADAQQVLTQTFTIPYAATLWRRDFDERYYPRYRHEYWARGICGCTISRISWLVRESEPFGLSAFATMADQYAFWPLSNAVSVVFTGDAPTNVAFGAFDETSLSGIPLPWCSLQCYCVLLRRSLWLGRDAR